MVSGTLIVAIAIALIGTLVIIAQIRGQDEADVDDDIAEATTMTQDHDAGDIDDL